MAAITMSMTGLRAKATVAKAPVGKAFGFTKSMKKDWKVSAFTVTLDTPDGAQTVECADDVYILDAAEVRAWLLPLCCTGQLSNQTPRSHWLVCTVRKDRPETNAQQCETRCAACFGFVWERVLGANLYQEAHTHRFHNFLWICRWCGHGLAVRPLANGS